MKVLITGASGFIGNRLIQTLKSRGLDVIALGRNPAQIKERHNIEAYPWDALDEKSKPIELPPIDVVIHLAGEPVVGLRWSAEKKKKILDTRVLGTRNLGRILQSQSQRPGVFISASAIGFYGSRGDEVLTEESSRGEGFLADVCEAWEQEAQKLSIPRTCIFRIGIVLGKEGGVLKAMLPAFKLGLGGKVGSGHQWMSWIHVEDLVSMIATATENPNWNGVINAVSPEPIQNAEFTKALGSAIHRPTPFPVPGFVLKGLMGEMANETLLGSQKVMPHRATKLSYAFRFNNLRDCLKNLLT